MRMYSVLQFLLLYCYMGRSFSAGSDTTDNTACPPNYYGDDCQVYCLADHSNRFHCDVKTGVKRCNSGWEEPSLGCSVKQSGPCPPNFYDPGCSVFCKAEDSCEGGHYTCDPNTGAKICIDGWDLPELNCTLKITPKPIDEDCPDTEKLCVGGQCHNKSCCCFDDWTGPYCDVPIDHCSSNPCGNTSTCEKIPDGYQCLCGPHLYGVNCETYCKMADDCENGHFTCNGKTGAKECIEGWESPEINCTLRIIPPPLDIECPDEGFCANGQCHKKSCCCLSNRWTGQFCETRIDDCLSEPCQNEGTCQANPDGTGYDCLCSPNYHGNHCEILCKDADDCIYGHYVCNTSTGEKICLDGWAMPEVNCTLRIIPPVIDPECPENGVCVGGQCHKNQCCCFDEWTGDLCEIKISGCRSNPCLNQGTCRPTDEGYACICHPWYTGTHCETYYPQCPPNYYNPPACNVYCLAADDCDRGHYTCDPNTGAKVCLPGYVMPENDCKVKTLPPPNDPDCPTDTPCVYGRCYRGACCCNEHYTGRRCETFIDYCASQPCRNGGTCTQSIGGYTCSCCQNFEGTNCESFVQRCPPNYYGQRCEGYCLPQNDCDGHFTCDCQTGNRVCLDGWMRPEANCTVKETPPSSDRECPDRGACLNGGACFQKICCCPRNFRGELCEIQNMPCERNRCMNGGTCFNLSPGFDGDFQCICPPQWTGLLCDTTWNGCPPNYFNPPACNVFCWEADSCSEGHYTCGPDGSKICREHWECVASDCRTRYRPKWNDTECPPIGPNGEMCRYGECHRQTCCCHYGWTGPYCDIFNPATPLPPRYSNDANVNETTTNETDRIERNIERGSFKVETQDSCSLKDNCAEGHYVCNGGTKICRDGWADVSTNCTVRAVSPAVDSECPDSGQCDMGSCFKKSCCCILGYTGDLCQEQINPCGSSPCANGGTCRRDGPFNYKCDCTSFYTGNNCETRMRCERHKYGPNCDVHCKPENSCAGHYRCDQNTGAKICLDGYRNSNQNCIDKINEDFVDCPAGGCDTRNAHCFKKQCCCKPGFKGARCNIVKLPCEDVKCDNITEGAYCRNEDGKGLCCRNANNSRDCIDPSSNMTTTVPTTSTVTTSQSSRITSPSTARTTTRLVCQDGYYGPTCSVRCKADESSCEHGHYTCHPTTGEKLCEQNWGPPNNCTVKSPNIANDPECPDAGNCRNDGICFKKTCCCRKNYRGDLCETYVLPCDRPNAVVCQNGGTCRNDDDTSSCVCPDGFTGRLCENRIIPGSSTALPTTTRTPTEASRITSHSTARTTTRLVCQDGYYGPTCSVRCKADESSCERGHYTCHPTTGEKLCEQNWGPPNNCTVKSPNIANDPECPDAGNCRNDGICFKKTCCCPKNYRGDLCETYVLPCDRPNEVACQNGGTCVNLSFRFDGDFRCICPPQWTGRYCDTTWNGCPPNYFNSPACNVFCREADSCSEGHYTCGRDGSKICREHWECEANGCRTRYRPKWNDLECPPIGPNGEMCRYGECHKQTCCCHYGWTGPYCDIFNPATPLPPRNCN
ncbi:unnamed protein product [Owenia fusiformis]|uniref:Delta-like protein n=1 Tax=Owenia fusiformis TaxID=6347 RepID=A0A8J1TLV6_OWEFU|nr:unnamed protein product [Owenia fusiformis]